MDTTNYSNGGTALTSRELLLAHLLSYPNLANFSVCLNPEGSIIIQLRDGVSNLENISTQKAKHEQLTLPNMLEAGMSEPPEERRKRLARERQRRYRERKKQPQLNGQQDMNGTIWVNSGQSSSGNVVTHNKRDRNEKVTPVAPMPSCSDDTVTPDERDCVMEKVRKNLREAHSEICYNVWLADLELLSLSENEAVIKSSDFKAPILREKHMLAIETAFESALGKAIKITILSETDTKNYSPSVTQVERDSLLRDTSPSSLTRLDKKFSCERNHSTGAGARDLNSVCKAVFGWLGTEPTKAERSSVKRWLRWGFDANVMYLAWQLADKYADRSPLGYMNVVLEGWHKADIHDYDTALELFESQYGQQLRCAV